MSDKVAEILKILREAAAKAFADVPIVAAYLCGAQLGERRLTATGVDIAIYIDPEAPPPPLSLESRLATKLRDLSGIPNINVQILNETSLAYQGEVIIHSQTIYSRDDKKRTYFEAYTAEVYLDYHPHLRHSRRRFS